MDDRAIPASVAAARAPPRRYWAFLSYSHTDKVCADRLHSDLERFAVPRRFVGQMGPAGPAPTRFRPIFRDEEELGAAPDLNQRLQEALAGSGFLIVLCSPAAAASRWVDAEIRSFKAAHGEGRVLAVIVEGEPFASDDPERAYRECLPLALRRPVGPDGQLGEGRIEVIAADLRPGQGGRRLAILKLVSGMLGVGLDQLIQREAQRRQQTLAVIAAAATAGAVVLGGLSLVALRERDAARNERAQAEGLIEFMVGDLRNRLEPAGRLDVMDSVAARALAYYTAQQNRGLDAVSLGRRSRVLHLLGEIRDRRGDTRAAESFFVEAARATHELVARNPNDQRLIFDDAQSVYWVGYLALRRGHDDLARQQFLEYQRLADRLVALDPGRDEWQAEVAYANSGLGTVLMDQGRAEEAAVAFRRQLQIVRRLADRAPEDHTRQMDLAQTYAWLSDADSLRGDFPAALAERAAEAAIYARILAAQPNDHAAAMALVVNHTAVARNELLQNHVEAAIAELRATTAQLDRMIAASPDDASMAGKASSALQLLGQALMQHGDLAEAEGPARRARQIIEAMVRRDPTLNEWIGPRLGAARILEIKIAAMRAHGRPERLAALAPVAAEADRLAALAAARPRYFPLSRVAAEARLLAGDHQALAGNPDAARAAWREAEQRLVEGGAERQSPSDRSRIVLGQLRTRLGQAGDRSARLTQPGVRAPLAASHGAVDYRW